MLLTKEGLIRERLPEIKAKYDQMFNDVFGPVNTEPNSFIGQFTGILSEIEDNIQEKIQEVYDAMYPYSAEGTSLDGAVSLVGLTRISDSNTNVRAMLYGKENTLVPNGVLVQSELGNQFVLDEDVVISRVRAGDVEFSIYGEIENDIIYQIDINGTACRYTSKNDDDENDVLTGIAAAISHNFQSDFLVTLTNKKLRIRKDDEQTYFTISNTGNLKVENLGSPGYFICTESGNIKLPAGSLNQVITYITGWEEVKNLVSGDSGRSFETDEELRERHKSGTRIIGSATVKAITERVKEEVENVISVKVFQTGSKESEDGQPKNSIEVIVVGGDNQKVAEKIFEVKAGGIETWGNTKRTIIDDNGEYQEVSFSRAEEGKAWVKINVTRLNPEEVLSANIRQIIAEIIVKYGNSLEIGEDYILQKFIAKIIEGTEGVARLSIEMGITTLEGQEPIYTSDDIIINRRAKYTFAENQIEIGGLV